MELIKLERKRNKIRNYLTAVLIIAITMSGLLYLFAYAPGLDPNDKDMAVFSELHNLVSLFSVLNMAVFSVLSAVMYAKFMIEDYTGKRVVLLFSYPVDRWRILLSKISVVSIFTICSMVISNLLILLIFGISNRFLHMVNENFTFPFVIRAVTITLVMSVAAAGLGIVSAGIGFIKKSVPTTIISAVLITSFMCNVVFGAASDSTVLYLFAAVMAAAGILSSVLLMNKVNGMEAE